MTMSSSTPVWQETLVFAESYRRLLSPETVLLFELVDFAASLSRKEARKVGVLSADNEVRVSAWRAWMPSWIASVFCSCVSLL